MRKDNPNILLFLLLLFVPLSLKGQRGGESLFGILHLTSSARIAALGGYQVAAYGQDPALALYNPALANASSHNNLSLGFTPYIADINYGYGSYARHYTGLGTFFAGVNHLGYGDLIAADENGHITGNFSASETVAFLGFSRELNTHWRAGITLKPVFSRIEAYNSWGIAADAGIHYSTASGLFQGAVLLRNAGWQIQSYDDAPSEALPPDLQIGFSTKLAHAPFRFSLTARDLLTQSLDYEIPENEFGINVSQPESANTGFGNRLLRHLIFGLEFVPSENFFVAAGLNPRRRQELKVDSKISTVGYSWGFGFRIYKFHFSYASARYHLASSSNHFSITTNISDL